MCADFYIASLSLLTRYLLLTFLLVTLFVILLNAVMASSISAKKSATVNIQCRKYSRRNALLSTKFSLELFYTKYFTDS